MALEQTLVALSTNVTLLIIIGVWELVWKGFALWKSAVNKQKVWFVAVLVLNTLGILPIVYLIINRKKKWK